MKKKTAIVLANFVMFLAACSTDNVNESETEQIVTEQETIPVIRTSLPDIEFERYLIESGFDDVEDGSVITDNIRNVTNLDMEGRGITNLTGIADFQNLLGLYVGNNSLTSLNVSRNTQLKFLYVANNSISSIDVTNLSALEKFEADNNELTQLDISDNSALQLLSLKNNQLSDIDISNVATVIQLNVFAIEENPLSCIQVNSDQLNDIPDQWTKDAEDDYSLDCN